MNDCTLCPRECHADRANGEKGYCGVDDSFRIARCAKHFWEEPALSGTRGAGAVFFSGCSLRCVYCQNYDVSHAAQGKNVTDDELYDMILGLADEGVHCIDLVTPTHYTDRLVPLLCRLREKVKIPFVWNCGGYEKVSTLKMLDGLIDIYLPDFKYSSSETAKKYSDAADYPQVADLALAEMFRQTGDAEFDGSGIMKKGIIVRHLILPGGRHDSEAVLRRIAETVPVKKIKLSLMSQYTPDFAADSEYRELHRKITSFEYDSVLRLADELGFDGYCQERSSSSRSYTPDFSGEK